MSPFARCATHLQRRYLTLEPVTDAVLIGGCLLTHPGGPRAFGLAAVLLCTYSYTAVIRCQNGLGLWHELWHDHPHKQRIPPRCRGIRSWAILGSNQ